MNLLKFLWVLVGVLTVSLLAMVGYVVLRNINDVTVETQLIQSSVPTATGSQLEQVRVTTNVVKNQTDDKETEVVIDWKKEWQKHIPVIKSEIQTYLAKIDPGVPGKITKEEFFDITKDSVPEYLASYPEGRVSVTKVFRLSQNSYIELKIQRDGGISTLYLGSGGASAASGSYDESLLPNGDICSKTYSSSPESPNLTKLVKSEQFTWDKQHQLFVKTSTTSECGKDVVTDSGKSLVDQVTKEPFVFKYLDETVTLHDGQYVRYVDPKLAIQFSFPNQQPKYVEGDVNNDGKKDLAILYHVSQGGSGGYIYLAVFLNINSVAKYLDSVSLGDNVSVESVSVTKGVLRVLLTTFPDNVTQSVSYKILNNKIYKLD
jgi:hypothetical protein